MDKIGRRIPLSSSKDHFRLQSSNLSCHLVNDSSAVTEKLIIRPDEEVELRHITFFKKLALRTHLERKGITARQQFVATSASTMLQDVDSTQKICEVFLKLCMPTLLQHCTSSAKATLHAERSLQSRLKHRNKANRHHCSLQLNCLKALN